MIQWTIGDKSDALKRVATKIVYGDNAAVGERGAEADEKESRHHGHFSGPVRLMITRVIPAFIG